MSYLKSGIYGIECLVNLRWYVGASKDVEKRLRTHQAEMRKNGKFWPGRYFDDYRKYGIEAFAFKVIERCEINKLHEREQYWIDWFDSARRGYNSQASGTHYSWIDLRERRRDGRI